VIPPTGDAAKCEENGQPFFFCPYSSISKDYI
jgi:hypothetical protein